MLRSCRLYYWLSFKCKSSFFLLGFSFKGLWLLFCFNVMEFFKNCLLLDKLLLSLALTWDWLREDSDFQLLSTSCFTQWYLRVTILELFTFFMVLSLSPSSSYVELKSIRDLSRSSIAFLDCLASSSFPNQQIFFSLPFLKAERRDVEFQSLATTCSSGELSVFGYHQKQILSLRCRMFGCWKEACLLISYNQEYSAREFSSWMVLRLNLQCLWQLSTKWLTNAEFSWMYLQTTSIDLRWKISDILSDLPSSIFKMASFSPNLRSLCLFFLFTFDSSLLECFS